MIRPKKTLSVVILLFLVSLLLTGCAERTQGFKVVPDWSRGVRLGQTDVTGTEVSVALVVAPAGDLISLTWPVPKGDDGRTLYLMVLDKKGIPLVNRPLELGTTLANGGSSPTQPQLAISADGSGLLLAWIDESEESPGLYCTHLTPDGTVLTPSRRLSSEGFGVRDYQIASLSDGNFLAMWADRSGILAVRVEPDGSATRPATLSRRNVSRLGFQTDDSSSFQREIYYTALDVNALVFSTPAQLATARVYDWLHGPVVALETGETKRVYVGWTLSLLRTSTGGVIPEHTAFYISFPKGEPGLLTPRRISIAPWFPPAYTPTSGEFSYEQLGPPYPDDWTGARANFYLSPAALSGEAGEAAWGLSMYARTRWGEQIQPVLLVFDEGQVKGYQLTAWTIHNSMRPAVAADAEGNLYLAWLETLRKEGTFVYLASTAPGLRDAWDRPTGNDWLVELERFGTRLISAAGLTPVIVPWVVPSVVWMFFALFVLRSTSLIESKGRVIFLGAFFLHWMTKYLLTPEMLTNLPWPGYIPFISPLLTLLSPNLVIQLARPGPLPVWVGFFVPCFSLAVSLIIVRLVYLRRRYEPSALITYVLLGLIDSFIALEIYALAYFDPTMF
jgi:hypothetical protein